VSCDRGKRPRHRRLFLQGVPRAGDLSRRIPRLPVHFISVMVTIEELWSEFGFKPNTNQERAIRHLDGPLYLPAGPGSGKTRVLLWRTLNLIVFSGVTPEEIYLSTFTDKAALQLREGLRSLLAAVTNRTGRPYDTGRMYVGTTHALCQRLLVDRRFYPGRQRGRTPLLIDELDQYLHLHRRRTWRELTALSGFASDPEPVINSVFGFASLSRHQAVSNCIALFNRLSEECVDPTWGETQADDPAFRNLLRMYGHYQQSLAAGGLVRTDFALLQRHALTLLDSDPVSAKVFKHVIIDEYQDTNTIQERLFFRLARGHKNICAVGDDDQALYRFRGATVENFVDFPDRCRMLLGSAPTEIPLETNYRSRKPIVDFCGAFLGACDWAKAPPAEGHYRVTSKQIHPYDITPCVAVVATTPLAPDAACAEIAEMIGQIVNSGKVRDPNQVAFLYPSLKSPHVERMIQALEAIGLRSYAPRARTFLECDEATAMLGVFAQIFGRPDQGEFGGEDYHRYHGWLGVAYATGRALMDADPRLAAFVADRREELRRALADYATLTALAQRKGWDLTDPYRPVEMKRELANAPGLSDPAKRTLIRKIFDDLVARRQEEGRPFPLGYILKRATSIDWSLLDLFYRCCGFRHFIEMFDAAQRDLDPDEGPVCNLGLLSQYLSRFVEQRVPIITGALLADDIFVRILFGSYLYALFKRGESEYEDVDDPFPKGRVPFLTIHQAKGLEFPVVVLGNLRKDDKGPQPVETLVRPLLAPDREGEPLGRLAKFDIMRMYYVALSRAENLLVLAHFRGKGQRTNAEFQTLLDKDVTRIPYFDIAAMPVARPAAEDGPGSYSYTGDFLAYKRCPRQYLIFRKFDFAPSRFQTMLFGTLVHRTLDDLHQFLIARRGTG
jgi:DNA helicase-2/ATP-dependent DNA helicase PcrA